MRGFAALAAASLVPSGLEGHLRAEGAREPSLLVLVRSGLRPDLEARVRSSADTWMTELGPADHVFTFAADPGLAHASAGRMQAFPLRAHVQLVDCPEQKEYTCVMTEALRVLLPLMHQHDALVVIDDDAYLSVPNLKAALRAGEVKDAFGVYGCGIPEKSPVATGFCGGCGFGLTQEAALRLTEDPEGDGARYWSAALKVGDTEETPAGEAATRFLLRVDHDQDTWANGYVNGIISRATELKDKLRATAPDDVLLGESWHSHGLNISSLRGGLYGWNPKADSDELHTCSPPPITFHHLSTADKMRVHANIQRCSASDYAPGHVADSRAPCLHWNCK